MIRTYPDSDCISFLYDLDDDNKIDLIEYRRWNKEGRVSAPVKAFYDKNNDLEISCDEVAEWKDPLPGSDPCPPDNQVLGDFGI